MSHGSKQTLKKKEPFTGFLRERQLIGDRRFPANQPLIPVDHSTLWRWVKKGNFPSPIKIGPNTTAWDAQAVFDWIRLKRGGV